MNDGYRYISPANASRWDRSIDTRLPTRDATHEALGEDGMFAVIYDPLEPSNPIACAATRRWTTDLEGQASSGETGWEIKIVTTKVQWMRHGLAVQCVNALVTELVAQAREAKVCEIHPRLQIWVQAVDCLNGSFWRKQGWAEVRSYQKPVGHWGSKTGYRLLVLVREFDIRCLEREHVAVLRKSA